MKDVLEPFSDIGAPATACWCACFNFEDSSRSCDEHKAALVAEVRRLRDLVDEFRKRDESQDRVRTLLTRERDAARAEAERLRAGHDPVCEALQREYDRTMGDLAVAVAEASRVREALQAAREFVGWLTAMGQPTHEALKTRRSVTLSDIICIARAALRALDAALDGAE